MTAEPATEPRWVRPVAWAAIALALTPIVVAALRAVGDGWLPVGDNAFFNLRARDAFTEHNPLLGTWTSASLTVGVDVNNPGPLWFDLLAVPARIDARTGVAVGAALVNISCVLGIAALAQRLGGARLVVLAMVGCTGLAWAMGSELLFDPWQPHALLFPFLLTLVLAWTATAGDPIALPWLAFTGSLLVQTHVSYVYAVPVVGLCGIAGVVEAARRRPALRRHAVRCGLVAVVVGVACWVQPVIEQFTGDGSGNLTRLLDSAGQGEAVGWSTAPRLVASVVAVPSWWSRATFDTTFTEEPARDPSDPREGLVGVAEGPEAMVGLVVVGALLLGAGAFAVVRRDRVALAAVAVAVAAVGAGMLTAASMPIGILGITPHQLRWLWPVSIFVTVALLTGLLRAAPRPEVVLVPAVAVVVLAVLALPQSPPAGGPAVDVAAVPLVEDLREQLAEADLPARVVFDPGIDRFAEPYSAPAMDLLDQLGVEFDVASTSLTRQVGPARAAGSVDPTDALVTLREGPDALAPLDGYERVAFASTLDDGERAELAVLEASLVERVPSQPVPLSDLGRRAEANGALLPLPDQGDAYASPGIVVSGLLAILFEEGYVEVPDGLAADVARWSDLRLQHERSTVGVFLRPGSDG